jgi:hypothetical protein
MPNFTINCALYKSENYNGTNWFFKLAEEPQHAQTTVYPKAKAIPLVTTIP